MCYVRIYSRWSEYLNAKSKYANAHYLSLAKPFRNISRLQTIGQLFFNCLAEICSLVNPNKGIISIHSKKSNEYHRLTINDELKEKIVIMVEIERF